MRRVLIALIFLIPFTALGDGQPRRADRDRGTPRRHFLLVAEHTLRPNEEAELAREGVEIQQVLPDRRYVVRAANAEIVTADPRVASLVAIEPATKIERSAYREAALAKPFARIRVIFHADVPFDDARRAIERVGGMVDQTLGDDYVLPQRLSARIPFGALDRLAADDRVFSIAGPARKIAPMNANAALLSHVTPLYSAPYNLSGSGVVLSEFEFAKADSSHPEFQGRLITHVVGGDDGGAQHATHVAGTMIAAGLNAAAKGMAPAATLHEFDARQDYPDIMLRTKQTQLPPLGIVADNNSWGFPLSWQFDGEWVWYGGEELYGAYDAQYSTPYDALAKTSPVLFVQSSGNDGGLGHPPLTVPFSPHKHTDDMGNVITGETFCYSLDGLGTDCQVPCTATPGHCEKVKHPTHDAFNTLGPTATLKNVISVGALNSSPLTIASFSSRGPTGDGRVKPDLVAKGVRQYSTIPVKDGSYSSGFSGTSMAAPVVTGIAALLTEQWRRTFSGQNPLPVVLKTLMIAGADDLGTAGPDYTYGFGLVDAQASVDLILADNNNGSRIHVGDIAQGQQIEFPLTVAATQNLRVVVGWVDPEVLLSGTNASARTLVNDLDVKVIDAAGNATLPYVLDKNNPSNAATRGVNSVDNTEEVEIANAAPGTYRVVLTGTNVATAPTQQYVLIANAGLNGGVAACSDPYEPNDSEAAAFGNLVNNEAVNAAFCNPTDVDYYRIRTAAAGPLLVSVAATDTPLRVTLSGSGLTPVVADVAAGTQGRVSTVTGSTEALYIVKVEPVGTLGSTARYTLVPSFAVPAAVRRRATRH